MEEEQKERLEQEKCHQCRRSQDIVSYQMSLLLYYNNTITTIITSGCIHTFIFLCLLPIFYLLELCLNKVCSDSLISNISNMRGVKITVEHVK